MTSKATDLPKAPGAYALLLRLSRALTLPVARLRHPVLPAGIYIYCGSARGPGGIAARVGRHLRADKAIRWHVDQLTVKAKVIDVLCVPGGSECGLVRRFSQFPRVAFPVPGFGSSDCRTCTSHLLSVPPDFALQAGQT